jgi:hypothetical protein
MEYQETNTCLFVDVEGKLFRVKCPFIVKLKGNANDCKVLLVTKIYFNKQQILFEIEGKRFAHRSFLV